MIKSIEKVLFAIIVILIASIALFGSFSVLYSLFAFECYDRTSTHNINVYFYIPSFVFFLVLFYILYLRLSEEYERSFFTDLYYLLSATIAFTILFCFFNFYILLTTNHFLSQKEQFKKIKGNVVYVSYSRDRRVTILNAETKKEIDFTVSEVYKEKDLFDKRLNIGYWGILYNVEK